MIFVFVSVFIYWYKNNNLLLQPVDIVKSNIIDNSIVNVNEKIRTIYPNINKEQLDGYISGETINCENNNDCITIVSIVSKNYNYCGEISDRGQMLNCYNLFISDFYPEELASCKLLMPLNLKINCLIDIFRPYDKQSDCLMLSEERAQKMCNDIVNYKSILFQDNQELCNNLGDQDIKKECIIQLSKSDDIDGDGLTGSREEDIKTDPFNKDTDGDGLLDGDEVYKYNTDPLKIDTDTDGINDGDEISLYRTKPKLLDTDNDGLNDVDEINIYKTNPLNPDTDGDGFNDIDEIKAGYSPNGPGLLIK